jgi:hypothetical protein
MCHYIARLIVSPYDNDLLFSKERSGHTLTVLDVVLLAC